MDAALQEVEVGDSTPEIQRLGTNEVGCCVRCEASALPPPPPPSPSWRNRCRACVMMMRRGVRAVRWRPLVLELAVCTLLFVVAAHYRRQHSA